MSRTTLPSFRRTCVIAQYTLTQLTRMRVFYFLVAFAILMLVASFFEMPWSRIAEDSAEQELIILKSTALGAMTLFAVVFAISSTALLIPKDLEDRTLYTILSKPVPRLDYLIGKLLGVLLLIALCLMFMDALLCVILKIRTSSLLETEVAIGKSQAWPEVHIHSRVTSIEQQGLTWDLQAGIVAILLKSSVIASIALLISTFSSSTLFTIIISVLVYFIGHITADARGYWLLSQKSGLSSEIKFLTQGLSLIFPDFQLYNIMDASIEGKKIPFSVFWRLILLTFFYSSIYSVLAWFSFRKKEF